LPITRKRKEELVAQYVEYLEQSNGFVVVEYERLSVAETQTLRGKIREAEGKYMVAKNTLFTKALQQIGWPVPDDLLKGPTGVAFGLENMPGVAKAILDFTQDKIYAERIEVTGGIMTGDILDAKQVEAVSKLPTLDELRAQLAGLIVSPAQGIVNVVYAATGQVVNVINAYANKTEEGGEAA
jgi:large subunit ribosomal protein L10